MTFLQKKKKKQSSAASVPILSTLEFRLGWFLSTPGATSTQTLSATKGAPGGGKGDFEMLKLGFC